MIDLEKPMHFTKEQSEWIKAYVILKKKEARADTIEEIKKYTYRNIHFYDAIEQIEFYEFLEQLKEQK